MTLKETLALGAASLGPFVKSPDPGFIEIAGLAGFGHAVIDLEHGPLDYLAAQNLVRAAEAVGIAPVLRVSANAEDAILRALDIGAVGVHIPHVDDAESAARAVAACYYHPRGGRGVCCFVRASRYGTIPKNEWFTRANDTVVPVLHLEGRRALDNLDDILAVEGIGVVFLGPYDLSQSCGVPGEVKNPQVVALMRDAAARARERGVAVGTFVESVGDAAFWYDHGVRYLCYSVDTGIYRDACRDICAAWQDRNKR